MLLPHLVLKNNFIVLLTPYLTEIFLKFTIFLNLITNIIPIQLEKDYINTRLRSTVSKILLLEKSKQFTKSLYTISINLFQLQGGKTSLVTDKYNFYLKIHQFHVLLTAQTKLSKLLYLLAA